MKKFALRMGKIVSCIVLVTVMVLAGVLPSMASEVDDFWITGTGNTITGNATDGWDVALDGGDLFNADTYAVYEVDGYASELQITMDLSAMVDNDNFVLQIGSEVGDIYHWTWNGARVTFLIKRAGDNLDVYGHNGGAETTHVIIENFDFSVPHVFAFLPDDNAEYHLAVDGNLCLTPWPTSDEWEATVDYYVVTSGDEGFLIVGLLGTAPITLNNVKINLNVTSTPAPTEAPTEVSTEAPTETPTEVPTEVPTEAPTEAPSADTDTSKDDSKGEGDSSSAGLIVGIVIAVVVIAAVISIVLIKKKKK